MTGGVWAFALVLFVVHLFLYAVLGYIFTPSGRNISAMYPYWALGLAILFPLCAWYGRFKQRQPETAFVRLL
jgi:phosphoglycerol transferase MdoB-like AlkP superfamily enzyme